ncbi:hypothetical protein LUR56_40245 [Streptomyces sp. MT29]|nr:hypothetical protein [Streptomyces sp. MT29]
MAGAHEIAAERKRLWSLTPEEFVNAVVHHVQNEESIDAERDVQAAALLSPPMAPWTLDALETAIRQARRFLPRQEGESKRQQAARLAPFRAVLQEAMAPFQDVVDDLAHEEARSLAGLEDEVFARRWSAFILDEPVTGPVPRRVTALAFRSHRVAARTDALCHLMEEDPKQFLPSVPGESRKAHDDRVTAFRRRVTSERRFLRYAIQYAEARHGRMPSEPNVRLRALRLLGDNHPEELSRLRHQVRAELLEEKTEARRDARAVRRTAGKGAA